MPAENFAAPDDLVDPFYPDGYISTDQNRAQIIAQKKKYAASVGSINFKFPLKSFKRGFFQGNQTTVTAVREDLKTLLMTAKGERIMHKNMGTNISTIGGSLFDPINKIELEEKIKLEITLAVETYLHFLSLQNIRVLTNEDDDNLKINQIRISMAYIIHNQQSMLDQMTFTVTSS
jgi:phage baseplate assembly protein W